MGKTGTGYIIIIERNVTQSHASSFDDEHVGMAHGLAHGG